MKVKKYSHRQDMRIRRKNADSKGSPVWEKEGWNSHCMIGSNASRKLGTASGESKVQRMKEKRGLPFIQAYHESIQKESNKAIKEVKKKAYLILVMTEITLYRLMVFEKEMDRSNPKDVEKREELINNKQYYE